jgi:hypothetical protein
MDSFRSARQACDGGSIDRWRAVIGTACRSSIRKLPTDDARVSIFFS